MDIKLVSLIPAILLVIVMVVMLWGTVKMWKVNRFTAIILLALAVTVGIGFYALYGKQIFG